MGHHPDQTGLGNRPREHQSRELLRVLNGVAARHYRTHGVPEQEHRHPGVGLLSECDDGSEVTHRLRPAILGGEEPELRHVGGGPAVPAMISRIHHEPLLHHGGGQLTVDAAVFGQSVRQHEHPHRFLVRQPDPGVEGVVVEGWDHTKAGLAHG